MEQISKRALMMGLIATMLMFSTFGTGFFSENTRLTVPDSYHPGIIRVNVTHPNGSPAVCYDVLAKPFGRTNIIKSNCTDSDGITHLLINMEKLGYIDVMVRDMSGHIVERISLYIGPDDHVELDMKANEPFSEDFEIAGTVRDTITEAPVAGVNVTVKGKGLDNKDMQKYYDTTSNGRFSIMVPYSETPYLVIFTGNQDYMYLSFDVFTEAGESKWEQDVHILPIYSPDIQCHFRLKDADSGEPFTNTNFEAYGYLDDLDHGSYSKYMGTNETVGGWINTSLEQGEFQLYFYAILEELNVEVQHWQYLYVNSTPLTLEVPVDLPGWKRVEVEIWNQTSPLSGIFVSYNQQLEGAMGTTSFYQMNWTDPSGKVGLYVRDDVVTRINIWTMSQTEYLDVDPSIGPGPLEYNITIETFDQEMPPKDTSVRVIVKDKVTGVKVPNTYVRMYHSSPSGSYAHSFYTNMTGEYTGNTFSGYYYLIIAEPSFGDGRLEDIELLQGQMNEITIYVERDPPLGELNEAYFYVKDPEGEPVPGRTVYVVYERGGRGQYDYPVSDEDGRVLINVPAGEIKYGLSGSAEYRPKWSTGYIEGSMVPEGGGKLADLVVYPTGELKKIWGFVRDGETGEPIPGAFTAANSFIFLKEVDEYFDPFRMMMPYPHPSDPVALSWTSSGSVENGYYRMWGTENAYVYCSKTGYFPKFDLIEMNTRAVHRYDFYLDPIPELDVFINGTLVDEENNSIEGYVSVEDLDHDQYLVSTRGVNDTGRFSLPAYPGRFLVTFSNETLEDSIEIVVGDEGIEDLLLRLIPRSLVFGNVTNWSGEPVQDVNVTLIMLEGEEQFEFGSMYTNESGGFSFIAPAGVYLLRTDETELYRMAMTEEFSTDGWTDREMDVIILNRTEGSLIGSILGEGGPFEEGVPEALVQMFEGETMLLETMSNETGVYTLEGVPYGGVYHLNATPPEWLLPIEGVRPGYLMNSTTNITMASFIVEVNVHLPYRELDVVEWLDVAEYAPIGEEVPLDTPLMIVFSDQVNRTSLESGISITPALDGLNFSYHEDGSVVIVEHGPFDPNTTYEVMISGRVTSALGAPLREYQPVMWSFTTGNETSPEMIYDAEVEIRDDMKLYVTVVAKRGISLFFVVEDLGSFPLENIQPLIYRTVIPLEVFEWNTTYSYYFSDSQEGDDIAPAFAGEFTTPEEIIVEPQWEIYGVTVTLDDLRNWAVEASGLPNITIYIVIVDVTSVLLEEDADGQYYGLIEGTLFEWSTTYDYYFSDSPDGEDLAPALGGSRTMPQDPNADDDDDGKEGSDEEWIISLWGMSFLICCSVPLLIIVIIAVVIFMSARGKKDASEFEE